MSRRGEDDGFHPHPGDPWHPGWSSDDEPAPEEEAEQSAPAVASQGEAEPEVGAPESETARGQGVEDVPVQGGPFAPAGETPAEPPVAAQGEETTGGGEEAEAVRSGSGVPPGPAGVESGDHLGDAPTLFDWPSGRPSPEGVPAETISPLPSPAQPAGGPGEGEEQEPTVGEPTLVADEEEVEVEEWLAFAGGPPSASEEGTGAGAGPALEVEGEIPGGDEAPPLAGRGARWWPFGRRGRAEPDVVEEQLAEPWPADEREQPLSPQPPPWSPDLAWEETQGEVGAGSGPADGRPAPAGEEVPTGSEGPVPPPWIPQAELDRAVPLPVVPGPFPGEEPASQPVEEERSWEAEEATGLGESVEAPEEAEWAGDVPVPGVDLDAAEEAPVEPLPPVEPVEAEDQEQWEESPEPGAPPGAAPSPVDEREAPGRDLEEVGAPTAETAPPGVFDFAQPAGPGELSREEVFARAVTREHRGLAEEVAAADTAEAQLQALSAPMAGLESGVVGFDDVVQPGGEEEPAPSGRSDMVARVATGMLLVGILLGALWVGGELLAGFVGLLAMLGLAEFYGTLRRRGFAPLAVFGFLGALGLLVGTWFYGLVAILVAAMAVTVVCFFYYTFASRRREPLTNGSLTLLGVLWIPGTLVFAFPIASAPSFRVLVLAAAAAVVASDVGAFFVGRAWGSRPLAPVLSPSKTLEGLAGGVVLGVAVAVAAGYFLEPLNIRIGAALGLIVAVMAPLGDLVESMLKRSLGVKDMGSILPGHGGILDRLDAYLFVLPAVWVLYETLGLLH